MEAGFSLPDTRSVSPSWGIPLSRMVLLKSAASHLGRKLLNPVAAMEKLAKRLPRSEKRCHLALVVSRGNQDRRYDGNEPTNDLKERTIRGVLRIYTHGQHGPLWSLREGARRLEECGLLTVSNNNVFE
jgi:hypothetical protein